MNSSHAVPREQSSAVTGGTRSTGRLSVVDSWTGQSEHCSHYCSPIARGYACSAYPVLAPKSIDERTMIELQICTQLLYGDPTSSSLYTHGIGGVPRRAQRSHLAADLSSTSGRIGRGQQFDEFHVCHVVARQCKIDRRS